MSRTRFHACKPELLPSAPAVVASNQPTGQKIHSMEIFNAATQNSWSLLHITQAQAAAIWEVLRVSPHGLRLTAGWHGRKPVIDTLKSMTRPVESFSKHEVGCLVLETGSVDRPDVQKILKAFGNRVADAARKPLQFERGLGGGKVHLIPAFHHLAACGSWRVNTTTEDDLSCCACILAALTPASGKNGKQFSPFGHVFLRDAEIRRLRDHAYKGGAIPP